jgi:ankyrin repeat protein
MGTCSRERSASIFYAAAGGHSAVLSELLQDGGRRLARDEQGQTALHVAVKGRYQEVFTQVLR